MLAMCLWREYYLYIEDQHTQRGNIMKIEQINKLRQLHNNEQNAYDMTYKHQSLAIYDMWVKACDELNAYIASIVTD